MARKQWQDPRRWKRRCMVKGCPEYGVWETLPPGEEPLPTEHPRSHYSLNHDPNPPKGSVGLIRPQR